MVIGRFLFVVYGFELLVRVWPVSKVLVFVVAYFFGCVSLPFLVVPPSMSVCIHHLYISIGLYHFPNQHMMCVHP